MNGSLINKREEHVMGEKTGMARDEVWLRGACGPMTKVSSSFSSLHILVQNDVCGSIFMSTKVQGGPTRTRAKPSIVVGQPELQSSTHCSICLQRACIEFEELLWVLSMQIFSLKSRIREGSNGGTCEVRNSDQDVQ